MIINKKSTVSIVFLIVLGCVIMAFVDIGLHVNYIIKSTIKLMTFILLPIVFLLFDKSVSIKSLLAFKWEQIKTALLLGGGVFGIIIGTYFAFGKLFDFSKITTVLESNLGVTAENFIYVAIYIALINSLAEEFFFRGFGFIALKKASTRAFAYFFSAIAFSAYHVSILDGWFTGWQYAVLIFALFIAGLILIDCQVKCNT